MPDEGPRDAAATLDGVGVAFGAGADRFVAVDDTHLTLGPGEFVALVGPTGCGKSSLLNLLAGLSKPDAGQVTVRGTPLAGLNTRAGYLFQGDALMPWKTARENVAVALDVMGVAHVEARHRADEWLARVGLAPFGARFPHQLSGGQRKRVALAQTLVRDPDILLMDEPFGPLDAQTRALMGDLLLDLWSRNRKAVLFVTHDLDEAIALADRVLVMSSGPASRIIAEHPVDLPRPRHVNEVKLDPRFHALRHAVWRNLRAEVLRAWSNDEPAQASA